MATRTITRMFDTYEDGVRAVTALENAGIPASDVSIVANSPNTADSAGVVTGSPVTPETSSGSGVGAGATLGTVFGGGAGLLAGIGALAIPGVGPIVAAGWLVATLAGAGVGATAGGLIGSLTGAGVHHDEAHVYAEGIRRGGTLVSVRADETEVDKVEELLGLHPHVDVQRRGDLYRAEGWEKYDEAAGPYPRATAPDPAASHPVSTVDLTGVGPSGGGLAATVPPPIARN